MKSITTFLTCLIGLCPADDAQVNGVYAEPSNAPAGIEAVGINDYRARLIEMQIDPSTPSGNYLASRFAQRHHDWKQATRFLDRILEKHPDDLDLQKRAMVLAMGAGNYDSAIETAKIVLENEPDNALALLFVAMEQFKNQDYTTAQQSLVAMPAGSLSAFIVPLLNSWSKAALNEYELQNIQHTAVHIYHAMLIADYMGQADQLPVLLQGALSSQDMTTHDLERFADVFAYTGKTDDALDIYTKVMELDPENISITHKIEAIASGQEGFQPFKRVTSPQDGMARTMFDMARLLYNDYSDESAKIFTSIALYLQPDMSDARILMGYIASRNDQFEDAIAAYNAIGPDDGNYFEARRRAADLLEDNGRIEDALAALRDLVATHDDLTALIQIGDIYRRDGQFEKAVQVYSQAEEKMGGTIPADYWQVHYVRGISYEQLGDWPHAEEDLETALEFQPNHPFVLNYLGYSWADQGVNLKRSLEMIQQAASLRPEDGYITDSLGWVLFRLGKHQQSVPPLERAVELLPYDPTINDHLGDAYWSVGRRREARFQWERARNYSEDAEIIAKIADKIDNGLSLVPVTETATIATPSAPKDILDVLD